jgi:phage gpG-like protein
VASVNEVKVVSNITYVRKATEQSMKKAARMVGGTLAGHAVEACPVDTGLLRNSITFALGGEEPQITTYRSNDTDKNGKKIERKEGSYSEKAPGDDENQITVYVGTNVEYAPYQELGAPNRNLEARPFLRPAMENFTSEIEQIIEQCFTGLL